MSPSQKGLYTSQMLSEPIATVNPRSNNSSTGVNALCDGTRSSLLGWSIQADGQVMNDRSAS